MANNDKECLSLARVAQLMSLGVGYNGSVGPIGPDGRDTVKICVEIQRKIVQYSKALESNYNKTINKTITPFELGVEWLTGSGARHREFTTGDYLTELLRQHEHIQETKQTIKQKIKNKEVILNKPEPYNYSLSGVQGVGKYIVDYSTLLTAGQTGNLAVTYLGSYGMECTVTEITATKAKVQFVVTNASSMQSASRPPVIGYLEIWKKTFGKKIHESFEEGWGSITTQRITWYEEIKLD